MGDAEPLVSSVWVEIRAIRAKRKKCRGKDTLGYKKAQGAGVFYRTDIRLRWCKVLQQEFAVFLGGFFGTDLRRL